MRAPARAPQRAERASSGDGNVPTDNTGTMVAPIGGWRAISRYQWLVFLVVWAGWTLDAADFGLFSLVLRPALTELLGFGGGTLAPDQLAQLGKVGGLLSMC